MFFRFNCVIIAESEVTQYRVAEEDGRTVLCVAEDKELLVKKKRWDNAFGQNRRQAYGQKGQQLL